MTRSPSAPAADAARSLHERVAALLTESGVSQGALARAVGITQPGVSRWLRPKGQGGAEPDDTLVGVVRELVSRLRRNQRLVPTSS